MTKTDKTVRLAIIGITIGLFVQALSIYSEVYKTRSSFSGSTLDYTIIYILLIFVCLLIYNLWKSK